MHQDLVRVTYIDSLPSKSIHYFVKRGARRRLFLQDDQRLSLPSLWQLASCSLEATGYNRVTSSPCSNCREDSTGFAVLIPHGLWGWDSSVTAASVMHHPLRAQHVRNSSARLDRHSLSHQSQRQPRHQSSLLPPASRLQNSPRALETR